MFPALTSLAHQIHVIHCQVNAASKFKNVNSMRQGMRESWELGASHYQKYGGGGWSSGHTPLPPPQIQEGKMRQGMVT